MNNSTPYLSIIIPSYNEEKLLLDTIDHVALSNYFLFELVIVDDGSNDLTDYLLFNKYDFKPSLDNLNNHKYQVWDCFF